MTRNIQRVQLSQLCGTCMKTSVHVWYWGRMVAADSEGVRTGRIVDYIGSKR